MDEKHLTILEAWRDFYDNEYPTIKPGLSNREKEAIAIAEQTAQGKTIRNGKIVNLGINRVRRLLETYAPGVYTFHQGEPFFTKP